MTVRRPFRFDRERVATVCVLAPVPAGSPDSLVRNRAYNGVRQARAAKRSPRLSRLLFLENGVIAAVVPPKLDHRSVAAVGAAER